MTYVINSDFTSKSVLYIPVGSRADKLYTQQTYDFLITSLLHQNDTATSFWRYGDIIIMYCVCWVYVHICMKWTSHPSCWPLGQWDTPLAEWLWCWLGVQQVNWMALPVWNLLELLVSWCYLGGSSGCSVSGSLSVVVEFLPWRISGEQTRASGANWRERNAMN